LISWLPPTRCAARKGLDIQLIEFSDYVAPNAALDARELQANSQFLSKQFSVAS
jgi:ABC-type metal ion transport system substrate-binding protein